MAGVWIFDCNVGCMYGGGVEHCSQHLTTRNNSVKVQSSLRKIGLAYFHSFHILLREPFKLGGFDGLFLIGDIFGYVRTRKCDTVMIDRCNITDRCPVKSRIGDLIWIFKISKFIRVQQGDTHTSIKRIPVAVDKFGMKRRHSHVTIHAIVSFRNDTVWSS